jgi:biotin transport system ATP-binding protein
VIEIRNLSYRYPDGTYALRGIDLTISKGEFLLVCGANGSGKTTLIRLIAGLFKPTQGFVRVNGIDQARSRNGTAPLVGMVFQDADSQILGETVREDVSFGPENLGLSIEEIAERVDRSLRVMGLSALSDKPCHFLSGGEKRRVAIAGVLAMAPEVILFDEPFSHLDYPAIREVLRQIVDLHRQGHTLVITTHDVEKVIAHVDHIAILQAGELKAQGSPDELVTRLSRFGVRPPCYTLTGSEKMSWLSD